VRCAKQTQFGTFLGQKRWCVGKQGQFGHCGLGIADWGFESGRREMRVHGVDVAPNKANLPRFRAKTEGAPKDKANSGVGRLPRRSAPRNDIAREIAGGVCRQDAKRSQFAKRELGVTLFDILI
jgi:hypothetical protein